MTGSHLEKPTCKGKRDYKIEHLAVRLSHNKAVHALLIWHPLVHYNSMSEYIFTFSHFMETVRGRINSELL